LRYRIRHELFLRPAQLTFTFRNKMDQTALPIRGWGAFMPPNGVGGGGVHWNAETWRFLPSDFVLKTHLTQRYGEKFIPQDCTIQDWASPMRISNPITTSSNISAERRGPPGT
jgi:gluconate 2-dehydrogenase alpha chain